MRRIELEQTDYNADLWNIKILNEKKEFSHSNIKRGHLIKILETELRI